jgi:dUTPase
VAGLAVRVTLVPFEKLALQVVGQLIPLGLLVTVPDPDAGEVTVNSYVGVKEALTVVAAVIVRVQAFVPEQGALQPENA